MVKGLQEAFFHLEGDNLYFRGLDTGGVIESGYACPLFELRYAKTVARYVSSENLKVYFDEEMARFIVEFNDKKTTLKMFQKASEKGNMYYVEFRGWTWIKDEIKELGT